MPTTFAYGVQAQDTFGLDPDVFHVHIGVHRKDGRALTAEQLAAIMAALGPLAAAEPTPAGDPARVAQLATRERKAHDAAVAKVAGKPASKAKRPAARATRKTSKAPTRKAARRPAKG